MSFCIAIGEDGVNQNSMLQKDGRAADDRSNAIFREGPSMRRNVNILEHQQTIIGMLHLLPLPGAPRFNGNAHSIVEHALADAAALAEGGVDAIMIENFGDVPFFPDKVPLETVTWMTRIGGLIRDKHDLPLGVCVLRNDGRAALAIAHSIGAQFIRICVLGSPRVTDQGLVQATAYDILRDRARLGADIKILADVDIKHSYPLASSFSLQAEAADLISRSLADALIVTGTATGLAIKRSDLSEIRGISKVPVFVGSGVTDKNIKQLSNDANGFIIGTSFKESNRVDARVSIDKVRAAVSQLRG
jgi:membrane complex biogenesis BtpA family protein